MTLRLSHSGKNKYLQCANSYKLHYVDRWRPITMSSALLFGSAIDVALNNMLLNKGIEGNLTDTLDIFNQQWEQGEDNQRNRIDLPLNPNIKYFKSDWQPDILEKRDWAELFKHDSKFFDSRSEIDEQLKAKVNWLDIPEEKRMVYNYGSWLCLKKKGQLIIEAFEKNILPQIKEVISIQKQIELDDGDGNIFNGVIDYVARLHDGRVMIMDNKTTSTEYDEESVGISEQLATYYAILNIFAKDPENDWNYKIDGAGYSVLSKKIIVDKTKTCKSCNHVGQGSHKTCDNTLNGKRCGGEWDTVKVLSVKTQFITGKISDNFAETVLENASVVKSCIELGFFPKNFSVCSDIFGSPCQYIGLCHNGDTKGLVKLENKDK